MPVLEPPFPGNGLSKGTGDAGPYWTVGIVAFWGWILFSNLGGAALFEPDEGRNAEIAREVLLLKDWVTPHYDFMPRLDKPVLYFDLVALSYRLFGVSEQSARLPSAIAALACVWRAYGFARSLYGRWAALWSSLILLTSGGFFALSRIVIMDMLLTLFISTALCCFFLGQAAVDRGQGKIQFLLMYAAMGGATLSKGPIGFILPGMIILFYLLLTNGWRLLYHMELGLGIALFLVVTAPWYVLAELRNPGYLNHFFWQENVTRFTTTEFKRSGPWYYFIAALSAGFLPWTVWLPAAIARSWKCRRERERLFLILWVALPLLFFSVSSSKLFHYILPIYPALAIFVGASVAETPRASAKIFRRLPSLAALFYLLTSFVVALIALFPELLPPSLQAHVRNTYAGSLVQLVAGMVVALILVLSVIRWRLWQDQALLYLTTCAAFTLFVFSAAPIAATVAQNRSSRQLAEKAKPFIGEEDQLVLYEGYPSSLPFYLKLRRPIWVVWSGTKSKILGSDYVAKMRPEPVDGYGQVLFTYQEFAERWKTSERRFVVFVDDGALARFETLVGPTFAVLLKAGGTVLIESEVADTNRDVSES